MKKSVFCLVILILLSSLGTVVFSEAASSDPMNLTIAVHLVDSDFSRSYFGSVAIEDVEDAGNVGAGWLEFEAWFMERFGEGHTLSILQHTAGEVAPDLVEAGFVDEDIARWIQPKGEDPDRSIIDVFIVSYDPAYVTLPFDETVSVAGMILVGYKENSQYPEVAKAVAEYFAEKAGVRSAAAE